MTTASSSHDARIRSSVTRPASTLSHRLAARTAAPAAPPASAAATANSSTDAAA